VNGLRGGTPTLDLMQRRVDLDLWYAGHASIALDLLILLRTPFELLRRRNAY
jgi:undecaprenyl-phosphate galactose phosphotransferase/putative colanic acid biosynthesis UDP-glucose lipid carrier transferase